MTDQELIKEFGKIELRSKDLTELIDQDNLSRHDFYHFKKGYSLAQETIAELESRLEQSVDISVVNELNETIEKQKKESETLDGIIKYQLNQIKFKDAEIEKLKSTFAGYENFKENERQLKAIAEARELTNVALKITEERLFWIKDEFIMESEQVEEWREKAKAWLESTK